MCVVVWYNDVKLYSDVLKTKRFTPTTPSAACPVISVCTVSAVCVCVCLRVCVWCVCVCVCVCGVYECV